MYKWWLVLLLFSPNLMQGQIVITVAGNGSPSYTGDGGCALVAGVGGMAEVAVDNWGNYYFTGSNRIRKVSTSGIISTYAGTGTVGFFGDGGPATLAQLNSPVAIAFDLSNNLYFTDKNNNRIRKIEASTGIITTIAGNGTAGFAGDGGPATLASLNNPYGLAIDTFGNVYISDHLNYRIRKIDITGTIHTIAGIGSSGFSGDGGLATAAELSNIYGICTDNTGNIYITENGKIRKVDIVTGIISTYAGMATSGYSGDSGPATLAQLGGAIAIAFDRNGNLFIGDMGNNNVRKVDNFGIIHTVAGNGSTVFSGDGGPATAASLWSTRGVALDTSGNLYISDNGHFRIRKVELGTIGSTIIATVVPTPNDTVCFGVPVTYTTTVIGGTATSYQWYKNGVVISGTGSTYSYIPASGDSVRCVITGTIPCGSGAISASSNTVNMVVLPYLVPTISISGPLTTAIGNTVTVNATVSGTSSSYLIRWYKNSTLFTTTTTPTLTYTKAAGTDTIAARVVSTAIGCYDSTLSGLHIITVIPAGVQDIYTGAEGSLIVYPNPAKNTLYITVPNTLDLTSPSGRPGGAYTVSLTNLVGQTLLTKEYNSNNLQLDISTLPTGTYLLKATDNTGRKKVAKFNKQ